MIQTIIILLILLKLNLFKGWFLALWIIDISLKGIEFILKVIAEILKKID